MNLHALSDAIDTAADALGQDLMDSTWQTLSCSEVESLAEVFRLTGHADTAAMIVGQHAWGDEPGDDHFPFVGAVVAYHDAGGAEIRRGRVVIGDPEVERVTVRWDDGPVGRVPRDVLHLATRASHDYRVSLSADAYR